MMLKSGDDGDEIEDYSQHLAYRLVKRFFPIWPKLSGHAFLLTQKEWMQSWLSPKTTMSLWVG
jgi:tellurite resistance protein TerC